MKAFARLPSGLVQCLTGAGDVGQALVSSPGTHVVCFTGGIETGRAVARACADTQKRCLIEASGNDPFPVMSSAPMASGGARPAQFNKGWFVEPTVLTEVTPEMDIMNDERFGPAAPICRVGSFEEAVELANQSRYGLGACVYTTDLDEAMRSVHELESGMVWVNAPLLDNDAGPFGGRKLSGQGRQLGAEGLDTFRHTKLAMIDPGCNAQDFWWFPYRDEEAFPG